ncbi:VOC family protein [Macrococcoides caseolyticum]|uniref:VOC family protein n=1 Tax=Macrococcoides caseolyticum TaxID=69966 RepID=UPI001F3C07C0|nr:VOC family protein [Macrococcus caseolyticus]MCE4957008.1 VOC family protein [Macrococcus caseolyticus]
MNLLGLHHVTLMTSDIQKCYDFYHHTLGLKLVKKTVNMDAIDTYHLYFGDNVGQPGTNITFFEYKNVPAQVTGTNILFSFSLRVPTDYSLYYFKQRFDALNVKYDAVIQINGKHALPFYDFEDRLMYLISDELNKGIPLGQANPDSPVDSIHQILGLGPVMLAVEHTLVTASVLTQVLGMERTGSYEYTHSLDTVHVFKLGEGGNGGEVHLLKRIGESIQGPGGIHHVAFRVKDHEQLEYYLNHLNKGSIPNTGIMDQYYYKSLYFRDISGIRFEIATDIPGMTVDETIDDLGESLSLPPRLEEKRSEIEDNLKPLV